MITDIIKEELIDDIICYLDCCDFEPLPEDIRQIVEERFKELENLA